MLPRLLNAQGPLIHLMAGLLPPVWFYSWQAERPQLGVLLLAGFFALLPDVDSQASVVGRLLPFLSRPLEQRFGHRQVTHSLLALVLVGGVTWAVFGAGWWLLTAAYGSHLLVDMLVGFVGVPLLWPNQTRFYLIRLRPLSLQELGLGVVLGGLLLLPLRPAGREFATGLLPQEDLVIQPTPSPTATATPTATPQVVVVAVGNVYDLAGEIVVQVGEWVVPGQLLADLATQRRLQRPTATATPTATAVSEATLAAAWPTVDPWRLRAIENDLELAQANYHSVIATGTPNPTYVARLAAFAPQLQERRDCVAREGVDSDPGWRCQQELQQLEAEMGHWAVLAQPSQPDPLLVQIARERYDAAVIAYNQQMAALTPVATATPVLTEVLVATAVFPPTPLCDTAICLPAHDPTVVRSLIAGQVIAIDIATIRGNAATVNISIRLDSSHNAAPPEGKEKVPQNAVGITTKAHTPTPQLSTLYAPTPPLPVLPLPLLPSPPAPPLSTHLIPATVQRVIDGDTIHVHLEASTEETVRLLGVDTPETVHPSKAVGCFGQEASQFTASTLPPGTAVWLELDEQTGERDIYGRLLAHLWVEVNGQKHLFNLDLLNLGYATHNDYGNPSRYNDLYAATAAVAQQAGAGLWSACPQE